MANLLVEPLYHLPDVDAPLAGNTTLAGKIQGKFLDHDGDGGSVEGAWRKYVGSVEEA